VPAFFVIEGGGGTIRGNVNIRLPAETRLPIRMSMVVPVEQTIPVNLNVPVDIALADTQLSEPFTNLRNLLEPYVRILDNLPGGWKDVPSFVGDVMSGKINLLRSTEATRNPWPGFSASTATTEDETPPPVVPVEGGISPTATFTPTPLDFNPTPTFTPFPSLTPTPAP
jgi:hypothetical protein